MHKFFPDENFVVNYKFLIGAILPRPIAWVSTKNSNGTNNLAPFSFFTAISAKPMIIAFSPMIKSSTGEKKDTVINIEREKEFVVNFCPAELRDQVALSAKEIPHGEDEFLLTGLTPIPSEKIKAFRIKESPIHFECILRDTLNYGDHKGGGRLITGEVVCIHVSETLYDQGRILTDPYNPLGRGAGDDWILCHQRETFQR